MKKKELEKLVLAALKEKLVPFDFAYKAARRSYVRKTDSGKFSFHLAFLQYRGDFDVVADLGIRLDAIHERFDPKGEMGDYSFGVEVGNWTEGKQKRWTVNSEETAKAAVMALEVVFKDIALPYFEKYSDPSEALELLQDPARGWLHSPIDSCRSLAISSLKELLRS